MRARFVKNAFSNLGRGSAGAILALILPPILIRHMSTNAYAVWVLILQVTAYVGYLDFGLQTAVGRYVAFANEKNDPQSRNGIFSTAFAGLSLAALLGFALVFAIAMACPHIFPSVPATFVGTMRLAMLIVGITTALGLPASAWNGAFIGLQRFEIPAVTTLVGKILSALGLIASAITGRSLLFMAAAVAVANLFSYFLQFAFLRRVAPEIQFRRDLITSPMIRELAGYSFSLVVWSFSMLLVNGLDLLLVGRFDFSAVTPYSVSSTVITFFAGVQNAIFGVIMPHAAQLHAHQDSTALGSLLLKTTRLGVLVLLLTGLPLIVFAVPIIKVWIGSQFGQVGGRILTVLVIANVIRLIGAPYATVLAGTGQQRLVTTTPLMEGISNFLFSILLGLRYGAIGVAWGTLIGAAIGILAHTFYNIPRTRPCISVSEWNFLRAGFLAPVVCGVPVCLVHFLSGSLGPYRLPAWVIAITCSAFSCLILTVRAIRQSGASDV